MKIISFWQRAVGSWRQSQATAAVLAGGLALLLSLSVSQHLNRNLLNHVDASAALLSWQNTVASDGDRAVLAMLQLCRASLDAAAHGHADGVIRTQLDDVQRSLKALVQHGVAAAQVTSEPLADDLLQLQRELPLWFQRLDDDIHAARPVSQVVLDTSFNALVRLIHDSSELRRLASAQLQMQQSSATALRIQALLLMYLLCLMFSLTVAISVHWVRLARREARTRGEVDLARQEAVAAGELAAAASRDKSKFLGMLSHELLTPLQSIVSSMDMIESKGSVNVNDPVFMRLREGALALRARMSDLVDYAKMSVGRLAVNPRKFRVDRLIEDVIADHEEAVVRKDLDVHWEPRADLRQPVLTDPRRVRQILDNLVSNAIKYTARGGITIEAMLPAGENRLCLEVRDTGIGIAPDRLGHIFDPFYRVATSAQLAEGSGLGLAVVRSLIDLLQGEIHVESALGEGSRFMVSIPVTAKSTGAAWPRPSGTGAGKAGALPLVLIVDDAHDARAVVAEIVRGLGYRPTEAGSGREALRLLGELEYAAVLLDIELPDLSGFDVIRQIRAGSGPNRGAYFVMMSASHDSHEAATLFNVRLDKPIQRRQLEEVLQQPAPPP